MWHIKILIRQHDYRLFAHDVIAAEHYPIGSSRLQMQVYKPLFPASFQSISWLFPPYEQHIFIHNKITMCFLSVWPIWALKKIMQNTGILSFCYWFLWRKITSCPPAAFHASSELRVCKQPIAQVCLRLATIKGHSKMCSFITQHNATDIASFEGANWKITFWAIIHKWRKLGTVLNFPRSGRPTKITWKSDDSKSVTIAHPGGQKWTQNNI